METPGAEALRIALVTRAVSWEGAGGGEVLVRLLAERLARLGHAVTVLAVDARGVPEKTPFALVRLPNLTAWAVRKALRRARPQVVDAHNMESAVPAIVAARTLGLPVVVTVNSAWPTCLFADMYRPGHGVCATCSVGGVRDCFERRPPEQIGRRVPALLGYAEVRRRLATLRHADRLVVHSHAARDLLARNGLPERLLRVVPNFDEPALHREPAPEDEAILSVGALTNTKGVHVLLEAFSILASRRPHALLRYAGRGFMEPALAARARELGLSDRVEFLGYVPHEKIADLYARARVAAFTPITEEAFGRAIFEAWGAGVPLVASRISAPGEIVRHMDTGLLVPPEDPAALAEALERLLEDRHLAQRLAEHGRRELAKYHPDLVVPRWIEVYREAIG